MTDGGVLSGNANRELSDQWATLSAAEKAAFKEASLGLATRTSQDLSVAVSEEVDSGVNTLTKSHSKSKSLANWYKAVTNFMDDWQLEVSAPHFHTNLTICTY